MSLEGEWVCIVRRLRWEVRLEKSNRKKAQRCETAQTTISNQTNWSHRVWGGPRVKGEVGKEPLRGLKRRINKSCLSLRVATWAAK